MRTVASEEDRTITFGNTEWLQYMKYRPAYPQSLNKLILSHHQTYSNRYELAHDVGTGIGIFAPILANQFGFKHVHISDPSSGNIKQAQQILTKWHAKQRQCNPSFSATLTMSRTAGEELDTCTPSRSVDLVTVMEAAHWMDGVELMSSAARALKPDGTLAIVTYCPVPLIKGNTRADMLFKTAMGRIWSHALQVKQEGAEAGLIELLRGLRQGTAGLEFIDIDEAIWKNVRRVRLRAAGHGDRPHDVSYTTDPDHYAPSHMKADESYESYEESDELAQGWEAIVDHDWFRGYIQSMEQPGYVVNMPEYKDLMKALREDYPESQVHVEWTTDIILATRR